ncbi:MAG: glutaredoxin family protein [Betaproteobacteria bacterium]
MARAASRCALACGLVAAVIAAGLQAQPAVYRYVGPDGRIVYSDRPPPDTARNVETKRLGPNVIEVDAATLATRTASENFPITLYTFACGEICQTAEATLKGRGVPFSVVNVEDPKGAERLKALTGEMTAPVLQVGDKLMARGFNETRWQALLDEAGYPRSATPRPAAPARPAAAPSRADPSGAPASAPSAPALPNVGGGYPKD